MKSNLEQTEIEAPYELPEGWKWCRLGDVGETLTGSTPSKKKTEYYGGEFPFFKPADLEQGINLFQSSEYLSAEGKKVSRIVPAKSTLICCIGSIGKSGYSLREGTTNQQINAIIPHKYIDSKYLFYAVNTEDFINQLWSKASSTTISIVNKSKMDNCIIPLPPTLAEQQRIVNRIESMFAKLDEAKEKAQNVVDGFETHKAAILHKAFTGELTAKWRKENGVSDDSWEVKRFDEFCLLKRGFDLPATQRIEGMYPLVSSSGIIDTHNEAKVKAPGIVTGRSGSIGKVYYIEEDFFPLNTTLYSQNLFGNNARYVYYYLSNFDFKSFSSSTAVPTLNRNNFSKVELKVPALPEQVEIVRILDIIIEKENKAKQAAGAVLEQIELLKKSILARAFRGKI